MDSSRHRGWIYFRMVRCLYMAHAKKRGVSFEQNDFVRVVKSVGKLAWQTLLSGNPMFRKEDVIREVGEEVFEWGLLIGDEDSEGLSDETADILVNFAHRSIQEFFGAFYFILRLSEGETIDSLLGDDCERPIFMVNLLFLEFCLFFLQKTGPMGSLLKTENKETVCKVLVDYMVDRIDQENFVLSDILSKFPVFGNDNEVLFLNNWMPINIAEDVLPKCCKIQHLSFKAYHPIQRLLPALNSTLKIKTLNVGDSWYRDLDALEICPETELFVNIPSTSTPCALADIQTILQAIARYCQRTDRRTCVHLELKQLYNKFNVELSTFFQDGLHGLHLGCRDIFNVVCKNDIPLCRSLRHFSLSDINISADVLRALRKGIQRDNLSNLNYLSLSNCSFKTEGILRVC